MVYTIKFNNSGWLRWVCILFLSATFSCGDSVFAKDPVKLTPQELSLAASLKEKQKGLEKREKDVEAKEARLVKLERELDEKLTRIMAIQQNIASTLAELEAVKDRQFKNLVKVYSAMSATKAAELLNEMDDRDAVEILKAMKTEEIAKIIPKIDRDKAVRISRDIGLL